jgi:1-acyl-sn-glycerol-3-phosphate acyltransferase
LKGSKVVLKSSLKYVPLLGSSWSFNEYIFVKRVWETDQKTLVKELGSIFDYPKDLHYTV